MNKNRMAVTLLLALSAVVSACGRQVVVAGGNLGPALVVEQFLRAVNAQDLERMGLLFGTKDGSISSRDSKSEVEKRMFTIASILRHDDFEVLSEQIVPGRTTEATQLTVKIVIDQRAFSVPFTLVRAKGDRWLVEAVALELITAPRRS